MLKTALICTMLTISFSPTNNEEMYKLAKKCYTNNNLPEAQRICEASIINEPDNIPHLKLLSKIYNKTHNYNKAIIIYEKILELCPSCKLIRFNLAITLLNNGKIQEAFTQLNRIKEVASVIIIALLLFLVLAIFAGTVIFIGIIAKVQNSLSLNKCEIVPWKTMDVFLVLISVPALLLLASFVYGPSLFFKWSGVAIGFLPLGIVPLLIAIVKYHKKSKVLGLYWFDVKKDLAWAFAGSIIVWIIVILLRSGSEEPDFLWKDLNNARLYYFVFVIFVNAILCPICEEIFNRGFLYTWIRTRIGIFWGVIISSFYFSLSHFNYSFIPSAMIMGIILAVVYQIRRSLYPSIIIHSVINTLGTLYIYWNY